VHGPGARRNHSRFVYHHLDRRDDILEHDPLDHHDDVLDDHHTDSNDDSRRAELHSDGH